MTVTFEFSLDYRGKPCIKFKHHDKDNSIEQQLLKHFIQDALDNQCKLVPVGGFIDMSNSTSWNEYELQTF